ncbi:SDR family NAD(P)-dependent oxidoreductase [Lentibacillus sp. CBA3610]|uniref:SDR family NAD(P)-dependent oxidoreductase n=1 Tax=Lentibacillus sp. CBA3610 TaxID=2518176 RepID=UPI0015956706|nr:glucose 1-dehydrogenase [Lentibacillus sp. CBA3610]QKY70045.1 glucose 1-dehydrogenase [Lentibacillus sp. CBA3610]
MINKLFDLTGKVAVITGASQGLGIEIAKFMAESGASVALIARNEDKLKALEKELTDSGYKALAVPLDIKNTEKIQPAMEKINDHFGQIDILLNNAGTNITKPAEEITEEDWDQVLDLNLKSAFFCCQAAAEYIKKSENGKIINMSSQMAAVGYYKRSAYSSSKGGITQLTRSLAIEWANHNINVNAVAPTFVETPLTKPMFEEPDFQKDVMSRIPLGRLAKPEDLFGAILYLSSASSSMVTGQTIFVDGGWTVW